MTIDIETVLAVIITAIALNLIFIGFYIVGVLREVKNTVRKAGTIIDEVDQSVKDGVGKMTAMEKPLQAIATTSVALAGVIKGSGAIKKATESILAASNFQDDSENSSSSKSKSKKPKWFKKGK